MPGLIIEDMALTIEDGGVHTGVMPAVWGTAVDALCQTQNFQIRTRKRKKDVSGGCAGNAQNRYGKSEGMITISAMTLVSGANLFAGVTTPEGRVIRVSKKNLSTLATYEVYVGVIEEWEQTAGMDGAIVERVTIDLNPQFA
jgi:hypothetical protein